MVDKKRLTAIIPAPIPARRLRLRSSQERPSADSPHLPPRNTSLAHQQLSPLQKEIRRSPVNSRRTALPALSRPQEPTRLLYRSMVAQATSSRRPSPQPRSE